MKEEKKKADLCSIEDLEQVSGGLLARTGFVCPRCGWKLFRKNQTYPERGYVYYCSQCTATYKEKNAAGIPEPDFGENGDKGRFA